LPLLTVVLCLPLAALAANPGGAAPAEGGAEEVLVEGQSTEGTDPLAVTESVSVVAVDARLPDSADVADVLDRVAGTTVVHLGGLGDFSAVSIRGSSLRQVQIFLDGVPLNPDGSDVVNLSELPLRAFSRVEVWRGSAPPRYAAAPVGGVVDLVTADEPGASASITAGQYQTGRAFALDSFAGKLFGKRLDGMAVADFLHTRGDFDYFDDNGTIYTVTDDRIGTRANNDKNQLSTLTRLRLGSDRLRLSLLDVFLLRDEGLPGHIQAPSPDARLDTVRNLAVASVQGHGTALAGQGRLWLLQRGETLDDRQDQLGTGSQWQRGAFSTVGIQGHGQWAPAAWLLPSLTLTGRRDGYVQTDLFTDQPAAPRVRLTGTLAAAAELRWWHDRVLLRPVLQGLWLDNRALGTDTLAGSSSDQAVAVYGTPRLGLAVHLVPPLTLKANLGRTVRPPDLTELFGDRGTVIGNTELRPERGLSADVGFRLEGELPLRHSPTGLLASLDLAHFWSRTQDLIVLLQNSQRTSVPTNFGLTWVQGLEAAASLDLGGWVDSQSTLTWTISRNLSSDPSVADKQLPRIPALEASQSTSLHWKERLRLGHTWTYTDGSYWDATNFYRAAPRPIQGVFLRVQPDPRWPSLEASVLNLGDRIVQVVPRNPLDITDDSRVVDPITDYAGYPLPGRTFLLTLRWSPPPPGEF
ncbi:MAG: TonB-dependent receptor, partial [Oligoflexia bacterium]|nr:TonB-dependent receptor [Oligoflexia bacterium]